MLRSVSVHPCFIRYIVSVQCLLRTVCGLDVIAGRTLEHAYNTYSIFIGRCLRGSATRPLASEAFASHLQDWRRIVQQQFFNRVKE